MIKRRQSDYYRLLGEADREADCSGFILFLLDATHDALAQAIGDASTDTTNPQTPVETPVETPVKTPERILSLLRAKPTCTLADLAATVGKSQRAVERAVARLQEHGRVRRIGPRKGGRWEVLG